MEKFAAAFKKVQKINKAIIGAVLLLMIGVVFLQTFRSVYKELHADHETGAADNK